MPSKQTLLRSAIAAASLVAFTGASHATLTVYTNEAAFLAAVSAPGVDTFDDLPIDFFDTPISRSAGSYSYNASAQDDTGADDGFYGAGSADDVWLSTNYDIDTITFSGFSGGVRAAGGLFFASDILGSYLGGQSIVVVATDADGSSTQTIVNSTTDSFLGFVSNGALTSITVTATQSDVNVWPTVNNLTLAAVAAVPEPQTYAMMLAGLAAVGFVARRRRA